jgi:hypothetical protein
MSKTEVYSWRLDPELKQQLEGKARAEKTSVGNLLDRIVREWLGMPRDEDEEAVQRRLHAEFEKVIGTISSGDPHGSEQVKERVRAKLMAKRERWQRDAPPRSD